LNIVLKTVLVFINVIERSQMKKNLILLCVCVILNVGVSCVKKDAQEPPQQQQPEKQPETTASRLPKLSAPVAIIDKEKQMWSGDTASPEVVDWNNDGKKDLLVGMFSEGKVMLFLNTGTDVDPKFKSGELLTAGGEEIHVEFE